MGVGGPWKDLPAEFEKLEFNILKIQPLVLQKQIGQNI